MLASRIEYRGRPAIQVAYADITERKLIEEKLRQSEERYRLLIQRQSEGLGIVDQEEQFVFCNPAGEEIFGVPPGGLIGRNLREFTTPETFQIMRKGTQDRLAGKCSTYELEIIRPDGEKRQLLVTATPWRDKDGVIVGATAVFRDESERKLMEEKLRESEERYRSLFDQMRDGVYLSTHEGRFVDINPAFVRMFGYSSKQEMLDIKDIRKELYFSPEDRGSHFLDTGQEEVKVFRMRRKDGSEIWVEDHGRYIHDEQGKVIYHEGLLRDVTERVRAERALSESEESYRLLFEESPVGVGLATLDGTLISANKTLLDITGYSLEEFKKINLADIYLDPQARTKLLQILDRDGSITNFPARFKRKDGSLYDALLSASRLQVGGRDLVQTVCVDITRQMQMEEELRRRAQELNSLQETLLEITGRRELSRLLNSIVERAAGLLGAPGGGLYLCDPDRKEVRCVVAYNTIVNPVGVVLKYGEGAAGVVAQTEKPLIIDDYRTWARRAAVYEKDNPFGAVISAPMTWQGRVIGVIHVLRYDTKRFNERDLELLTIFANHAAIAVENARLYEQLDQHANQLEDMVKERAGKLAESEARYRRLFENSPVSLWEEDFSEVKKYLDDLQSRGTKDLRRYFIDHPEDLAKCASMVKVLDVNESTLSMYGAKSVEELRGELRRVFTHDFQDRFIEELVALSEGNTRFASEFDNQTLAGETKHVSLILNVVPGYENTLAKVLVSIIDLTERKAMETRLHEAERLAAVGETAAMVGHDLRNPLQGMAGALHLLKQESLTGDERDEMLRVIEKSLEYSDSIVRDLADYSGEIQLQLAEVTPKSIIGDAIGAVRVPKNLEVQNLAEDRPTLKADKDRLRRVFINLVENAIDAMPKGGTLTISSKETEGNAEITFIDTGLGMPEKVMDNPWRPLQTTKAKGLGLGLAICKRIVDAHGGSMSVKSKVGEGTTVSIRLPIKHNIAEVRQE
jgi:PAS domain S-box-containing protein